MFFRKKYHTLDRGLFAEALSIYSQNIVFDRQNHYLNETIFLNDVLEVRIPHMSYHHGEYAHHYSMIVMTYVEGIKMAEYRFILDLTDDKELYKRWEDRAILIMHHMPNQFVDLMNNWSKQIVSEYESEQEKIKQRKADSRKRKFNQEEEVLKKYKGDTIWEKIEKSISSLRFTK